MSNKGIDLVILAGGMGSRMASDQGPGRGVPKALLPALGRAFACWQIDEIVRAAPDVRRVILVVRGTEAPLFRTLMAGSPVHVTVQSEESPLGTGGAILQAASRSDMSDPFLVLNGDVLFSFAPMALLDQVSAHGAALQSIHVDDAARFGTLETHAGRVTAFREKTGSPQPGLINAGLYAFEKRVLAGFKPGPCSFENDIAPVLAAKGYLSSVETTGPFIDIGTPQSYAQAADFLYGGGFAVRQTA